MAYSPKTWNLDDPITDSDLNRIETGVYDVTDAFETFEADDTGWATTGITAATGWSVSEIRLRRVREWAYVSAKFTRTGADITVPAGGDLTNVSVGVMPSGYGPNAYTQNLAGPLSAGRVVSFSVDTNRTISLNAVSDGANIVTGDTLTFGGVLLVQ